MFQFYHKIKLSTVADKRTDPWLLVYSPVPVTLIFMVYLCLVWAGPRLMRHKEPVDLQLVLVVYNFAMVGLSAYMFYEVWSCYTTCRTENLHVYLRRIYLNNPVSLDKNIHGALFHLNSFWFHHGFQATAYCASRSIIARVHLQ